jgi:hypothetical protein
MRLLYQSLLRKRLENKREPLFRRQYWYPHNAIAQGTVIAGVPLIEKTCKGGVFFGPSAIQLKRKPVEYKYESVTTVEAR